MQRLSVYRVPVADSGWLGGLGQKKEGHQPYAVKHQRAESPDLFIVTWKGTLESA